MGQGQLLNVSGSRLVVHYQWVELSGSASGERDKGRQIRGEGKGKKGINIFTSSLADNPQQFCDFGVLQIKGVACTTIYLSRELRVSCAEYW